MKIYIVRHGETNWNLNQRMQGNTDIPLNGTGVKQAKFVQKMLQNKCIDVCYSSPLARAYETAKIICGSNVDVKVDTRLEERELGEFEGQEASDYDSKFYWNRKINSSLRGVEPANSVIARVNSFYEQLLNCNYKNILIVTHGAVVRALNYVIMGYNEETDFSLFDVPNCHVFEYEIEKKEVENENIIS